jgi:uncharacterized protein DUF4157
MIARHRFLLFPAALLAVGVIASSAWGGSWADRLDEALVALRQHAGPLGDRSTAAWATAKEKAIGAGAPRLAEWIAQSRDRALASGAQPVPQVIRSELAGFFPAAVLDRVRFRIGFDEDGTQAQIVRLLGTRAMALDHVVIFKDASIAADPRIWAHELAHVEQYSRWGVAGFADRYARDRNAIEAEAWEITARYTMWRLQRGGLARSPSG